MKIPTPQDIPNQDNVSLTREEEEDIAKALMPEHSWSRDDQTYGRHIGRYTSARYAVVIQALEKAGWVDANEENCYMDGKMPLSVRKPRT